MGIGKDLMSLCDVLGYHFHDVSYLENALTHSSYTNEMRKKGFRAESNESLEFLGDAVLEFLISEELYKRFSRDGEGTLTIMRQELVCENTLSRIALALDLGEYLHIGSAEESTKLRVRPKVLADALEALIAAIYLDDKTNGAELYKPVILGLFKDEIERKAERGSSDYKTRLQQFVEKNNGDVLNYEFSETGPDHEKVFTATAYINNNPVGAGTSTTKRGAEQAAAEAALKLFGIK